MLIQAVSVAPSLHKATVYIDQKDIDFACSWTRHISLPWAQLTHLTINFMSAPIFSAILSHFTQLTHCQIGLQGALQRNTGNLIYLKNLRSICFNDDSHYSAIERLLELLVVPMLESLTFGDNDWDKWLQVALLHLIDHSGCSIEVLKTTGNGLAEDEVITLMRAMLHLREFSGYTKQPISDSTLDTIVSENLSPNLGHLKGWEVTSARSFISFLQSRWSVRDRGLHNVTVWLLSDSFAFDKDYYRSILPELEKHGRK